MARHLAREGKRRSGGARPAAALGAETGVVHTAGSLRAPSAAQGGWPRLGVCCLWFACSTLLSWGADVHPTSGQKLAKKLKMAILGQGLREAWEKGDFALLRFPS